MNKWTHFYSGLMDMMDDGGLLFVLGHEIGHVVNEDIKEKIRLAYASSAVRKAVASQRGEAGAIAGSGIGALLENLLRAQFSQQEGRGDYGVMFIQQKGYGREPAISALKKLASLGNEHSFLSSHPAPDSRAERLAEMEQSAAPKEELSLWERIWAWVLGLFPSDFTLVSMPVFPPQDRLLPPQQGT
ncbi:MAG: M48 family metalloprotease [Desulfovibrionales bacterium]